MDNDKIIDGQENSIHDQADLSESVDSAGTKSLALGWQIVIAVIALVVVGFLGYPFLRGQLITNPANDNNLITEAQTSIILPETPTLADPDSAKAQFELGNTYVQSGQLEQAILAYQKAIELDPDYGAAYANMGVVYYQLQQFDLAALQYQKALELNPDDGEVAYNLGALYVQQALLSGPQPDQDLLNQAIAQLQQAQELSPGIAEPYFSLGVVYSMLNQTDEAIEAFETFLARDTGQDPRASEEAQRYLETLRAQ